MRVCFFGGYKQFFLYSICDECVYKKRAIAPYFGSTVNQQQATSFRSYRIYFLTLLPYVIVQQLLFFQQLVELDALIQHIFYDFLLYGLN